MLHVDVKKLARIAPAIASRASTDSR